ncbi:MAG: hypothetical protein FJ382_11815 [Verrucomicrobia bacterium]|nr:hypothetical protein [Verrucomicrobiota bacterium]
MDTPTSQETLDPKDWDAMRALALRMVDDALDHVRTVRDRPAWRPMPPGVVDAFKSPAPHEPAGAEAAYEEFRANILPYPMGTTHPRFWGWYMGSGTVIGALADLLASTLNSNLGGGNHAANLVEEQVVGWIKDMLGFPAEASGLLVSGGSMANLVGLAVARTTRAGFDVRTHGLRGDTPRLMFYASTEVHSCSQKALELMGLGSDSLRKLPVRSDYTFDVAALREAIAADRAAGHRPVCVIGNAGTINTGAVDDLDALAEVCREEDLWFHVDGAIGANWLTSPPAGAGRRRCNWRPAPRTFSSTEHRTRATPCWRHWSESPATKHCNSARSTRSMPSARGSAGRPCSGQSDGQLRAHLACRKPKGEGGSVQNAVGSLRCLPRRGEGQPREAAGVAQVVAPALHGGMHEADDRVVGERDHGHVIQNHAVQLLIERVARGAIHLGRRAVVGAVVNRVAPA